MTPLWTGLLMAAIVGILCAAFFWLGTLVQRNVPFVRSTVDSKSSTEYERVGAPPTSSWGPTRGPKKTRPGDMGHANPMGPPVPGPGESPPPNAPSGTVPTPGETMGEPWQG